MAQIRSKIVLKWSFVLFFLGSLFLACSPKKLRNTYGDNKEYKDNDSVGEIKIVEKKAKMPFDTTAVPLYNKK